MRLRPLLFLLLVCVFLVPAVAKTPKNSTVQVWLTTPDRSALFGHQATGLHFSKEENSLPTINVNARQKFQPINGFGFALTGGSAQLIMRMGSAERSALLRQLFSVEGTGIGVSYLRVSIGSSDMNEHVYTYDDLPAGETDIDLKRFSLDPDSATVIPLLKEILAINPSIEILASPWSAPSWMKTNDGPKGGSLKPEYYDAYARYFVKYIEGMRELGIPITAVTLQNEPLNPKNTPSMVMLAKEEDEFIKQNIGPDFQKAGIRTKIFLYDHNCDKPEYPLSILKDPAARKYVAGSAFHLYGGEITALTVVHNAYPKKNIYFTEQMVVEPPDTATLGIDHPVSRILIGATRNWSRNVLLWNLAADPNNGPHTNNGGCTMCQGAITVDGNQVTPNIAYYSIAHFSKFVRPGSVRIGSNDLDKLDNVAFLTPDGKMVLVVANSSHVSKSFNVRYHGKEITTSLTNGSVATYVW